MSSCLIPAMTISIPQRAATRSTGIFGPEFWRGNCWLRLRLWHLHLRIAILIGKLMIWIDLINPQFVWLAYFYTHNCGGSTVCRTFVEYISIMYTLSRLDIATPQRTPKLDSLIPKSEQPHQNASSCYKHSNHWRHSAVEGTSFIGFFSSTFSRSPCSKASARPRLKSVDST